MKIANLKDKLITCAMLAVVLGVLYAFQLPCPVRYLLHVPCPGCGMSRAYVHVLHLDFYSAFRMHPMFWSMPLLAVYYFADWRLFKRKWLDRGMLALIGIGFLVNWIFQLAITTM